MANTFRFLSNLDFRINLQRYPATLFRDRLSRWTRMAGKRTAKTSATNEKTLNYSTPALEKGLDVIELLAHQPAGLTKSQIARELKRTISEIFRMLLCLERRGYISQVTEERYSLTLKLFKLVQEHPPTERLMADSLPLCPRLGHV